MLREQLKDEANLLDTRLVWWLPRLLLLDGNILVDGKVLLLLEQVWACEGHAAILKVNICRWDGTHIIRIFDCLVDW